MLTSLSYKSLMDRKWVESGYALNKSIIEEDVVYCSTFECLCSVHHAHCTMHTLHSFSSIYFIFSRKIIVALNMNESYLM